MNKEQAIQDFFGSFGWKAYEASTVPDDAVLPRITYELSVDSLDRPLTMAASLWDRSYSWESVTEKKDDIAYRLYHMHPPTITCDTGRIYITPGSPFSQRMSDSSDDTIRRLYLNFEIEFFTAY